MRYVVQPYITLADISKDIYGNFSEHLGRCIYDGIYVGEGSAIPNVNGMRTDIVEALKQMKLPSLRWPGGCFADEYHWKDGIGDKAKRKKMINTHWGGVVEDNSFGTHEFMELCRQIGCEPYINGNVGSGTVQEMNEWVEYMTFGGLSPMTELRNANGRAEPWKLRYFGVGNENWGCGGNMRPEFYADMYRRFQTYVRSYDDNKIFKIACGAGANPEEPNYRWTDVLMSTAGSYMDGLTMHYYTTQNSNWSDKGSATDFDRDTYYSTIARAGFIDELVREHGAIMDRYDPQRRVALIVDEWGTWFDVEPGTNPGFLYQQNTMRDAMVAGLTLNVFNKHAARVRMANIAQLINVLQAVILTDGEQMLLTPTYHIFDMYKVHQGAKLVQSALSCGNIESNGLATPTISESASIGADGNINVTLCNLSADGAAPIEMLVDAERVQLKCARILTGGMAAHNTFASKACVNAQDFTEVKLQHSVSGTEVAFTMPACSAIALTFGK